MFEIKADSGELRTVNGGLAPGDLFYDLGHAAGEWWAAHGDEVVRETSVILSHVVIA